MALPGAHPSPDDIPILQKQIDGPISRLLKTVVDETPSSSPATTTTAPIPGPKTWTSSSSPVEDDPLDGVPMKLTIREIKFKDPLENRTPSDTATPLSDFGRVAAAEFQDSSRNRELYLDGDTNVQAATSDDAVVVVVDSATTEFENETTVGEGDPQSKSSTEETAIIKTSQCTASTVVAGEQESAAAAQDDKAEEEEEEENEDDGGRIPETNAELKESSATAPDVAEDKERLEQAQSPPEDDHRRSNDSLQVKVVVVEGAQVAAKAADEVFQEEDDTSTIDGLLLLHEVSRDSTDDGGHNNREEGDGKLQKAFQVELLEKQPQKRSDCADSELSSPAIVKEALNRAVARAPNTKASSPPPPEVDPETKVQSVVHPTSEPRVVVGEVEDFVQVAVNSADISDALVVVPSKQLESNGRTVNEHAEDSLKIRQSVRNSVIVDDLVTRIASYYSTQSEPEDDEEEAKRKRRPPVPIKTYQWEDIRRAKQQVGQHFDRLLIKSTLTNTRRSRGVRIIRA